MAIDTAKVRELPIAVLTAPANVITILKEAGKAEIRRETRDRVTEGPQGGWKESHQVSGSRGYPLAPGERMRLHKEVPEEGLRPRTPGDDLGLTQQGSPHR